MLHTCTQKNIPHLTFQTHAQTQAQIQVWAWGWDWLVTYMTRDEMWIEQKKDPLSGAFDCGVCLKEVWSSAPWVWEIGGGWRVCDVEV